MSAAAFGIILQAIGIGVEASGHVRAGKARAKSHRATAKQYMRELQWSLEDTDYRVRLVREAGAETLGGIEAETGKAGLAMTGTPLSHFVATAGKIEMAAAMTREAGRREAERYRTAIDVERRQARVEETAGDTRAMASVIQGLGDMFSAGGFMGG